MNFSGPFDAGLMHDSPVSLGGERFSFDSKPNFVQHHMSDNQVVVPDAHLLFSGDYMRIGSDLIISGNGQKFVIGNYFKGEARPVLTTKDGATLSGHIVDALTGHVHYAQATAPAQAGEVIGHVLKMSGSASVIRNGVSVELNIGDPVQKGDVVQTGSNSSVGMTFIDGSAFGMSANARMVLNEMIFDPNGSSNSSLISLVQGTITFVAGQTAKNGNMRVETPVATMGIRGTAVLVEIGANDGPTKFSVLVEPDGHTGSYNLYDKTTGQLIGTVSQAGQVTYVSVSGVGQPPTAIEQLKTLADQESAKTLIQEVFKLYFPNYNPDNANPKSQKNGFGSPGDNLNPFAFYKPLQDLGPPKVITIPGVGYDPVTGQPNPPRTFYNTKAQFSALPVFADQAFSPTIKIFSFKDVVKIDDPDIGNAPFYDIGIPFVAGSAIITSAVSTIPYLTEGFLKPLIHINQTTGAVSFDREQFNFLDDGQTVTFKIQVTATSGPDTGVVEIPITITGANDAPTIVVGAVTTITGMVKEDVQVASSHIETNGTITFKDVDLTDAHTATVELTSTSSTLPGFVSGAGNAPTTTKIGTFTIDPVSESTTDTNNQGSVGWHFSLDDNDPTLQSLAEGQTITQIYTITIKDDNGVPVTQTVTITITGTNDAPVLTADAAIHQADEVPDTTGAPNSVVDIATGTLAFADVDLSDTHTASAALHPGASSVVWSGGDYNDIPHATRDALNGAVTASVSESNTDTNNQGSVGWEFKLPDHLFDFLAKGQTLTLIYDVTVTDNNGLSSTKQITVQIGAANDQPVISVIDNGAAVKEDVDPVGGILKDHGSVTFTDADLTDTHTAHVTYNNDAAGSAGVSPALALALATALTVPSSALAAGDHDFNWDFALDTNLIQYLAEGETITATYTITVKDNSNNSNDTTVAKTVTVTITGTNDLPTISITNPATDTEGNTGTPDVAVVTVADHVSVSDVDASDVKTPYAGALTFDAVNSSGPAPAGGSLADLFTLDPVTGKISYDRAAFDYLAGGEHVTAVFTFNVSSGPDTVQKSITVTIDGANDAPVIAVTDPAADTEGNTGTPDVAVVTVADHVSITDVDASDVHIRYVADTLAFDAANSNGPAPAGGSLADLFTVDPVTGKISYDRAAFDYLAAGEHVTATFTFDASSGPDTVQKSITVMIDGENDAPTVAAPLTITTQEGNAPVVRDLLAGASDVDNSDALSVTNIRYSIDGGLETATTPHGIIFPDAHTINIDAAAIQHIPAGVIETIEVRYDIMDGHGGTVAQTETITITGVNDRPVLAAGTNFSTITEDQTTNSGQLVSSFATGISDPDDGALKGVAITGYSNQNGHWEYSIDGGSSWTQFGTYSSGSGLLLASDDKVRFVPNGENGGTDTLTYVAWDQSSGSHGQAVNTMVPGHTAPFSEDSQTASLTVTSINDAPVLNGDNVSTLELGGGVTKVTGIALSDVDAGADTFTVTATADHGTVATATGSQPLAGAGVSGSFAAISNIFNDGAVYTPDNASPTDKVTLTVTDGQGGSDTLNFVFKQYAPGGVTLTGTTGKDIIFSSTGDDTMTGLAGKDNFVFAQVSGHDTIMDFTSGTDKIDFRALSGMDANALMTLLANADHTGGDTLLHINGTTDTLLLKGVAALNSSDFILHA